MLNSLYVFKRPINIFHPFEHHFLASNANKSSQTCIINAFDALHLVYTCSLLQCPPTLIAGLIILLIKVVEIFALEFLDLHHIC
jgi:hypothetical protein